VIRKEKQKTPVDAIDAFFKSIAATVKTFASQEYL
jgi:hypothetical protein